MRPYLAIRSMSGCEWSVLVLAYPLGEDMISHVRDSVLNEMRARDSELAEMGSPHTFRSVTRMTHQRLLLRHRGLVSIGARCFTIK